MRRAASGFCVYNDPGIAIGWLLEQGAERVAYVDIDVHHGDGVQAAFYNDPRVLTISLHEHPATLFPGTGLPSETGGPDAEGSAVNVALPAGTRDAGWLRAFHAIVPPPLEPARPPRLPPSRAGPRPGGARRWGTRALSEGGLPAAWPDAAGRRSRGARPPGPRRCRPRRPGQPPHPPPGTGHHRPSDAPPWCQP